MLDPRKLVFRLSMLFIAVVAAFVMVFYLPESNRSADPKYVFPVIVLSGFLAGLVNFFILYVKIKLQPPPGDKLESVGQELNENPWVILLGYLIIGVAGAFLVPVLNVILTGLPGLEFLKPLLAQKSLTLVNTDAAKEFTRFAQVKIDSLSKLDSASRSTLSALRLALVSPVRSTTATVTPVNLIPNQIGFAEYVVLIGYCVVSGVYADTFLRFIALRLTPAQDGQKAA